MRYQLCSVWKPSFERNSLNEEIPTLYYYFNADLAITLNNGSSQTVSNVLAAQSTHTAITRDERIEINDTIKCGNDTFTIDYIAHAPRYNILYMKQVQER